MNDLNKKVKRVKPLIKVKKVAMDQEASALEHIRLEKRQAMSELKRYERLYISGIDQLNKERQSPLRENLEVLERGTDHYKAMWYECLKRMREIEMKERAQLNQLLMARKELKSMETLEDRYLSEIANAD